MIDDLTNKTDEVSQKHPNSQPEDHQVVKNEPKLTENETEITDL